MCLHTQGREALTAALAMKPDAMYILGDGVFTDDTTRHASPRRTTGSLPIHTLGMEVQPRGEAATASDCGGESGGVSRDACFAVGPRDGPSKSYSAEPHPRFCVGTNIARQNQKKKEPKKRNGDACRKARQPVDAVLLELRPRDR